MATTRELCELLRVQHKGWNLEGPHGVLRHLDQAQKMLWHRPAYEHIVWGTDGLLPGIATDESTGRGPYTMPATVRQIERMCVLVGENNVEALQNLTYDYGMRTNRVIPLERQIIAGYDYAFIPYWHATIGNKNTPATLQWSIDVGETDDVYRYFSYSLAGDLDSLSSALTITEEEKQEEFLLPTASLLIQGYDNGNFLKARKAIRNEILKDYLKDANSGWWGFDESEPTRRGF